VSAAEGDVQTADMRHREQQHQRRRADSRFEGREYAERMQTGADEVRSQQATEAQSAHEGAEHRAERNGRGTDGELKEMEPDDFVDEGGAAASQQEKKNADPTEHAEV